MQVKIFIPPSPPINSVFIIVLSIFRNSPIGGNSPISCGGKWQTYPEHFPQSQIRHQSFLFPWAENWAGEEKMCPFFNWVCAFIVLSSVRSIFNNVSILQHCI